MRLSPPDAWLPRLLALGTGVIWPAAVVGLAVTVPQARTAEGAPGFAAAALLLAAVLWLTAAWEQFNLAVLGLPLWAHWYLATTLAEEPEQGWGPPLLTVAAVSAVVALAAGAAAYFSPTGKLAVVSLGTVAVGACVMGMRFEDDELTYASSDARLWVEQRLPDFADHSWWALAIVAALIAAGVVVLRRLVPSHRGARALAAAATTFTSAIAAVVAVLTAAGSGDVTILNGQIWWLGLIAAAGLMTVRTPLAAAVHRAAGPLEPVNLAWLALGAVGVLMAFGGLLAWLVFAALVYAGWIVTVWARPWPASRSGIAGRR